jgi:hypothetical protein
MESGGQVKKDDSWEEVRLRIVMVIYTLAIMRVTDRSPNMMYGTQNQTIPVFLGPYLMSL